MISEKVKNQIHVEQGDITKLDCDCIVNAANRSLLGGGGIAEAFYGMPQELRAETLKRLRRICGQRTSCSGRTLSEGCDTIGAESRRTVICAAAPFCAGAFLQGESVVY